MKTKILKIAGITLLTISAFVWAAPYMFRGKIVSLIRVEIRKKIRGHVNFTVADVSLFRHFPKLSVGLENLQVTCVGEFQDDTLLMAKRFDLACDIRSLISGQGLRVQTLTVEEPYVHVVVHQNGHANWNILNTSEGESADSSASGFDWALQRYTIHKGHLEYRDEKKQIQIVMENLEQDCRGLFNADSYTLKTKTTSETADISYTGSLPYKVRVKASLAIDFHVDNKTHTYSFNTDQVAFNDLKFHTEGFFQWFNDSSCNMNIRYKVPSTNFKNLLSLLPSVYQKDFAGIESNGQVNFNGFLKGKYDQNHFPSYHANLYVVNGFFKYPDLSLPVENIHFGLQINNPDGMPDHASINLTEAHAEINKEKIDMHLLLNHLNTRPFIDFAFTGKLDLANISKAVKTDSSTRLRGKLTADIHGIGFISGKDIEKKDKFQSWGDVHLADFGFASATHPVEVTLDQVLLTLNPKNILIKELAGGFGSSHLNATGTIHNFYVYALKGLPLSASVDLKADQVNLRDWTSSRGIDPASGPIAIPANMDLRIQAKAEGLHFDNLDLQDVGCEMFIKEQTVHFQNLTAKGLNGDIAVEGTYSTLESEEHPEIALVYDVKNVDIQKTFLAFNSIRRIMPVAKFMTGNIDAHMTLNGKLNGDMMMDPATEQGEGNIFLTNGFLTDFGPMDKLMQSLDIAALKDIPLTNIKTEFSFNGGRVIVNPFFVQTKDMELDIEGTHGFDQSMDYDISLKIPRRELGRKGNLFVKNVVSQAAEKRIPVKIGEAVRIDAKLNGTLNNPEVKTDMDAVVSNAETDLNKEVDEFVNAKLDSAKHQLRKPAASGKKKAVSPASYKMITTSKGKKISHSTRKKTQSLKLSKKMKKPVKNYTINSKKNRATARAH